MRGWREAVCNLLSFMLATARETGLAAEPTPRFPRLDGARNASYGWCIDPAVYSIGLAFGILTRPWAMLSSGAWPLASCSDRLSPGERVGRPLRQGRHRVEQE